MADDKKKYKALEPVLQSINKNYVSLVDDDIKRNNNILKELIDQIINKMKEKDNLFKEMYSRVFFGGSFYDGLRIGRPDEFDLDLLLSLPKLVEPTISTSNIPGFVHLQLKEYKTFIKQTAMFVRYRGLDRLIDDKQFLDTSKVLRWMESVVNLALNDFQKEGNQYLIHSSSGCVFNAKVCKGGPAFTLKVNGYVEGKTVVLDIDLVPCFVFGKEKWPDNGFKKNPITKKVNDAWIRISNIIGIPAAELEKKKETLMTAFRTHLKKKKASIRSGAGVDEVYKPIWVFYDAMEVFLRDIYECASVMNTQNRPQFFIVPKPLKGVNNSNHYWRLSFQEQERVIIDGKDTLKPTVKLLKKMRDNLDHKCIASYYLKTIILWETSGKRDDEFWNNSLSYVFMNVLKEYHSCLNKGEIKYFWNKNNNLIKNIGKVTMTNLSGRIKGIIDDIEKHPEDPFVIAKYLLSKPELAKFRATVKTESTSSEVDKTAANVLNSQK